jgi:thioredoxin reductase
VPRRPVAGWGTSMRDTGAHRVNVKNLQVSDLQVVGCFFAIGHRPKTKILGKQLKLD